MPYFKNDKINLLFIHIPKTGGTSLELYFSKRYNIKLSTKTLFGWLPKEEHTYDSSLQHLTYNTIFKNRFKDKFNVNFNNIKIMAIVRNPYKRLVSDLFYFKKININSTKEETTEVIKQYLSNDKLDNHNLPQYKFLTDINKKLIPNISILHTETLTADMHKLNFKNFSNHDNKNKKIINYFDYLNDNSIKLINDFYDYDFKLFKYKKKLI